MQTKLKPYNLSLYSPHPGPVRFGQLALTLDEPRGYCVIVTKIVGQTAYYVYLDEHEPKEHFCELGSLIPTGKIPYDLIRYYSPSPVALDQALDLERSFPDELLNKPRKPTKAKGGSKTKKAKSAKASPVLSVEQQELVKQLLIKRLQEIAQEEKGA